MALDLLTVGESFAELDLVVRQLEDGSLTLATDDSLPDEARMRVAGSPAGLMASLRVGQVLLTPGLCRGLDALNGRATFGRWVWRAGAVRVEAHLPFGDRTYAPNQLRLVYGALSEAARDHGEQLLAVGRGEAGPETLRAGALPPSYLPGQGQKTPDDRTTQRYGAAAEVPGRPELPRADVARLGPGRPGGGSQRVAPNKVVTARPSGGGGIVALLLLLALGVAGYAAWALLQGPQPAVADPGPGTTPGPGSTPGGEGPGDPTPEPGTPDPGTPDPGSGPGTPEPGPGPTGPGPTPRPPRPAGPLPQSEEELLARLKAEPGEASRLVSRWVDSRWDRAEGARRRILEALPRDELPPEVVKTLVRSVREHPPDPFEAIDCWPLAPSSMKRVLLQQLAAAGEGQDEVAAFFNEHLADDTEDKLMQEGLLVLGRPRPETIEVLLQARGAPWALLGDGRALIEGAVKADLGRIKPLLAHPDEELRAFGCGLLGQCERPREALALLAPLLADPTEKVQTRAIEAAVQLAEPDASWPLARALQRSQEGVVRDALRDAFRRLQPKQTVPLLGKLYQKEQPSERLAAVLALEACEAPEAVPGLVKALGDKAREVKLAALSALSSHQKSKPALRPAVMEGLAAIRALALDKSDRDISRLASQLHLAIAGRMPDQKR